MTHYALRWTLYIICLFTQIYFFILEIPEIASQSLAMYFDEGYNIFDFTLPFVFSCHLAMRFIYGKLYSFDWMQLLDNIIEIMIIIGST